LMSRIAIGPEFPAESGFALAGEPLQYGRLAFAIRR